MLARQRCALTAVLALAAFFAVALSIDDVQAQGLTSLRSHGVNRHARSLQRANPEYQTRVRRVRSSKPWHPAGATDSRRHPQGKAKYRPDRDGKVVVNDRHPTSDGRPHWPHHPRYPRRPHHHWPPVIVTHPSGPAVVVAPGAGGSPPRVIGGGGGAGNQGQPARRPGSGVPPANERRYVPDEVVLELAPGITEQAAQAIARRHRLVRLESFTSALAGATLVRWRIPDRRSVPAVIRALQADNAVISAQPNYLAELSDDTRSHATVGVGDPAQYALTKLRMRQAHTLATGTDVLIAVIDSGIDVNHPELAGMIADSFDAIGAGDKADAHGTGIAGAIVAHARLVGTAPTARILAIRAFSVTRGRSEGTTFNISKGLNWAVAHGARVINMSFAGPHDPAIDRDLAVAHAKGIVLVAAAGNAGPKSPPLYPAANPNVIAVTATDEDDNLFSRANRGKHIAVAAPGVDIYLPAPGGIYQMTSGTSFAAAEVSGTVALLLQRKPDLLPRNVRATLLSTAHDLGPKGLDTRFGAGLVDAYRALISLGGASVEAVSR
jgi:hypothetical protein